MFQRMMTMAPADGGEPGGGSGGGDGGAGEGSPKFVTEERFNDLLNKALGARDKRFETKLTETLGGFGKSIEEKLAALAPRQPESDSDGGGKGRPVDPEVVKLRQQVEALTKASEAAAKRAADAEQRTRAEKTNNMLRAAFGKYARPEVVDTLVRAHRGDVQFDDNGEPLLELPDGSGATTIDAWAESWAKSDGAKAFLPAPNTGGSGTPRSNGRVTVPAGKKFTELTDAERDSLLG